MVFLVLTFRTDGLVVVRMHREGEYPDVGEGFEDSDYESSSEEASKPTLEAKGYEKKETKPESLPVLTTGSFARYEHRG